MAAVKKPKRPGVSIDMTPYVDVIMLILTFFMLTAQFKAEMSEDIKVTLPKSGNDTTKLPEKNVMTLVVTKEGDVYCDVDNMKVREDVFGDAFGIAAFHPDSTTVGNSKIGMPMGDKELKRSIIKFTKREEFKKRLIDLRLSSKSIVGKDLRIVVKGDKESDLGAIQDLMDMLKETKNTRFSLVTDMEQEKTEKK